MATQHFIKKLKARKYSEITHDELYFQLLSGDREQGKQVAEESVNFPGGLGQIMRHHKAQRCPKLSMVEKLEALIFPMVSFELGKQFHPERYGMCTRPAFKHCRIN